MQLYANHQDGQLFSAWEAQKKIDYVCLECGGKVRLRGGNRRHLHFYHTNATRDCRQNGKSLVHLQIQKRLLEDLGSGSCYLERHFPEIRRIADVCWEEEKVIFEVQCSSIDQAEIEARNHDYASLGYTVVWVFHQKRFKEVGFLEPSPFYFTDINEDGEGMIYDSYGGHKFVIDPTLLIREKLRVNGPSILKSRVISRPFHFYGDCVHLASEGRDFPELLDFVENTAYKSNYRQIYARFFRFLLERLNQ